MSIPDSLPLCKKKLTMQLVDFSLREQKIEIILRTKTTAQRVAGVWWDSTTLIYDDDARHDFS